MVGIDDRTTHEGILSVSAMSPRGGGSAANLTVFGSRWRSCEGSTVCRCTPRRDPAGPTTRAPRVHRQAVEASGLVTFPCRVDLSVDRDALCLAAGELHHGGDTRCPELGHAQQGAVVPGDGARHVRADDVGRIAVDGGVVGSSTAAAVALSSAPSVTS